MNNEQLVVAVDYSKRGTLDCKTQRSFKLQVIHTHTDDTDKTDLRR